MARPAPHPEIKRKSSNNPGGTPSERTPLAAAVFVISFALLFSYAFFVRAHELGLRPLHSDEGVNYYFLKGMREHFYYNYSHENYHGPLYFYLTAVSMLVFGQDNEISLRLSAVICGVLLMLPLLPLRKYTSDYFVLLSALFIALSPSLVFYARYAIHETLLILCDFVFSVSVFCWLRAHRAFWLYIAMISVAGMVCTKETFFIAVFCAGCGVLCSEYGLFREQWKSIRLQRQHLYLAILAATILVCAIYTAGFYWMTGIRELVFAIPQWIGRTSSKGDHSKPFPYYLTAVILPSEPYLAAAFGAGVLAIAGMSYTSRGRAYWLGDVSRIGRFLFAWFASSFFVYSGISYKTPWLALNVTLPGVLFIAWGLSRVLRIPSCGVLMSVSITLIISGTAFHNMARFNHRTNPVPGMETPIRESKPYGGGNPFSYVHTSPGMLALVSDIKAYWKKNPNARILVGSGGYWPLPFYLRERASNIGYAQSRDPAEQSKQYDIIIVDKDVAWPGTAWQQKYFRLSDAHESMVYFRPLQEAAPIQSGKGTEQPSVSASEAPAETPASRTPSPAASKEDT